MQTDWGLMAQQAREAKADTLSLWLLQARNLRQALSDELTAAAPAEVLPLLPTPARFETLLDSLTASEHSPAQARAAWERAQRALLDEDLAVERLIARAQRASVRLEGLAAAEPRAFAPREPVGLPPTRVTLGGEPKPGVFVPASEQPAQSLTVPPTEIDATPVTWGQFLEFVEDGGYDSRPYWSDEGWLWLQSKSCQQGSAAPAVQEPRRAPRYVMQTRGAVVVMRFGRNVRVRLNEPVMHVSLWEAQAWCRWAGRHLPSEAQWLAAATLAARRGFVWGDVWEWTATRYRRFDELLGAAAAGALPDDAQVVKGGSFASSVRLRHPQFRGHLRPGNDTPFVGFRSCAV